MHEANCRLLATSLEQRIQQCTSTDLLSEIRIQRRRSKHVAAVFQVIVRNIRKTSVESSVQGKPMRSCDYFETILPRHPANLSAKTKHIAQVGKQTNKQKVVVMAATRVSVSKLSRSMLQCDAEKRFHYGRYRWTLIRFEINNDDAQGLRTAGGGGAIAPASVNSFTSNTDCVHAPCFSTRTPRNEDANASGSSSFDKTKLDFGISRGWVGLG